MNTSFPTLRSRILRSFLVIIAVYGLLGFLLVLGVFIASGTTPKILHRNYDSTAAAHKMSRAWEALGNLNLHTEQSRATWVQNFESGLSFEENNITEAGEREAVEEIKKIWESTKAAPHRVSRETFLRMQQQLDLIVRFNEDAMFRIADANENMSQKILIGAISYFLLTLAIAALFANGLADRLAQPLKQIAEVLRGKDKLGKDLKLPEPTSLEVLILNHELKRLWKRLSEANEFKLIELIQQKKKLEAVLSSIEDALLVLNSDGLVTQCNDYFARLIGIDLSQILGKPWRDLSTMHDNYLKLRDELHEEMAEGQEIELSLADQTLKYSARWRPIETAKGQVTGVVYLLHDITEKHQRHRLRAEIIDLLSHELKTPLQSLGTASELLNKQRSTFAEDTQLLVDTISEDVDRIKAVANEFVQVTQTHSKFLVLRLEKLQLNQALPEWLKPFSVVARDKNVKLDFSQVGSKTIWANVDAVKFPWVISNLVTNAIRFSPPDTAVKITLSDANNFIEIRVEDEGSGILPEDRTKMFEPFYQSKTHGSDASRGLLGVGLTIAKEVVEAHEGTIEYSERHPRGSIFRITLPFPV